jgi:Extensin-like protein C-terminus
MRHGSVAFSALALIGVALAGCGLFRLEQREAWRNQAEQACLSQKLVTPTAYMSRSSPIDGPGACGMNHPFKVAAFAGGTIGLRTQATLACPIIPTIDAWLLEVVQPAAALNFASNVVEVRSGSYSCRGRNSRRGARLSEHAFGNALDVMGFRLADGREVTIRGGWRGASDEQEFLREVFVGACNYFTTVLGPGADAFHYDHFHLDLARHDPRGERRLCKPALKFESRIGADGQVNTPRQQWQPANPPTDDMEEDDDPFAVSAKPTAPRGDFAASAPAQPPRTYASQTYAPAPQAAPTPPPPPYIPPQPVRPAYPPQASAQQTYRDPQPPAREPMVLQPQLWTGSTIY